jgi:hypothetical protein
MELNTSSTHRGLNVKMKIGGLEALDLICSLILCATLNLIFGTFTFGPIIIFGLPSLCLLCLYFGKKNKPDDYLKHLIRYYLTTGYHSAAQNSLNEEKRRRRIF